MTDETSVEALETEWWQPLSCGCDPTTEADDASIEALETEWWQPLSCGCDPTLED